MLSLLNKLNYIQNYLRLTLSKVNQSSNWNKIYKTLDKIVLSLINLFKVFKNLKT